MSDPGTEPGTETTSAQGAATSRPRGAAVLEQMGGVRGLIYSSLPVVVFVPTSSAFGLMAGIGAALAVATLILVWRLLRRDSVQPAVSGFFAVGVSALIAYLVGASKGYFLLGIWMSLFWAVVFTVSVLVRRPLVGYIWGWVNAHDRRWRGVRKAVLAFDVATLVWVAVFTSRFVVQHHLYDADKTGWLGVARIAMGWPLTAAAALVTYLAIRAAQRALHRHDAPDRDDQAGEDDRAADRADQTDRQDQADTAMRADPAAGIAGSMPRRADDTQR